MEMRVEKEKQNIGALFDRIAAKYDLLNHVLSLNIDKCWRKKAVRSLRPVSHWLDVAIGTADFTLEVLKQHKAQQITGIDLSEEMMNVGRKKVEQMAYTDRVNFVKDSALAMPFASESFDALSCAFGVRNFSDLDQGLSEFYRVLRPGSQLCILELSYPENPFIAWCYDLYFSRILPNIGALFAKDKSAYTYLNRSVKHFIWGKAMAAKLREAGFLEVVYKPQTFGIATIYLAVKPL